MTVQMTVEPEHVPDAIRRLDTLASPDYVEFTTVPTRGDADRSAEEWSRVVLVGTSGGRSAPRLWRLLGLRLGPMPSPDFVQGWEIGERGVDWIRIETSSWFMTAHAVFQVGDGQLSLALFLRYDRPIAAAVWAAVGVMHRRAVPVMLRQAVNDHLSRTVRG